MVHNIVAIPPKLISTQKDVELCINAMFVNGMAFLTTVSWYIKYCTAQFVPNREPESYESALIDILNIFSHAGLPMWCILADQEFKPLLNCMRDTYKFEPNYANAQEHVPEAERNNCIIKECIRAVYHQSPFKVLPQIVIQYLVIEAAWKLNFFPAKGGCSDYYSLHEILHHAKLNYQTQC